MGRLRRYPFLDLRTSQFLLVSSLIVAVLGALGLAAAARALPAVRGVEIATAGTAVVMVVLAALFTIGCVHYVRDLNIPAEDVRSETVALAAQLRAHDVVVVNESANFGFAYYWPHGHITFHHDNSGQGFATAVSGVDAIYVPTRTYDGIAHGLREAVVRWQHAGPDSRLYIVRTHLSSDEERSWKRAFAALALTPKVLPVGSDPLLMVGRA
jgi:hypothetical protein